ncbi:hypothetical protein RHMOL_Rhmol10G0106500 [Rhododendron molle]|uniref:Uncharacterized protein n=1 Tax=Rhododendron molle TaxID=49168 RepID=A0ACC0M0S0_RHOML|nr:hypothetical protein RHMOL_Rhmol10G0106500 [Rhododendron molle]
MLLRNPIQFLVGLQLLLGMFKLVCQRRRSNCLEIDMQKLSRFPDQVAFVTVISAFMKLGRLDDACHLFAQMPNPNAVAWNVMISGHAKRGCEWEAVKLFQNMRNAGVRSTRSTLGSVLSAIAGMVNLEYWIAGSCKGYETRV